ncbi:MAG: electron transfer flavoprotein subunit beta/FixA family protein [Phycisphaerae bacterium]|nr:electron transfer flavoprotein subunit beta/FixA family protein [Phycisphaerae bacterium]
MRIIVPIKQVPETSAVKMDEATGTMIREGVEAIVNPLDLYAIETALQLREAHGGEVVIVSMGPPKAERAIREAIAMGCDRGVLISDKAFAGSDTWATSYALAGAIRKLGAFDLVLCGERATDGDTGQVGPGIASFLDLPVATYVGKIESVECSPAAPAGKPAKGAQPRAAARLSSPNSVPHVRVHRLVEDGYEVLEVSLPAVLTVVKEIANPRLPTLRGKQRAKAAEVPVWVPQDMELDPAKLGLDGSPTRVVKIFKPKVARECRKLAAGDEQSVAAATEKLVEFLKTRDLI